MKQISKTNQFILVLTMIMMATIMSACGSQETANRPLPVESRILTPGLDGTTILLGSPVQIQSAHANSNVTKVQLLVQNENEPEPQLIAASQPTAGYVLQEWVPQYVGHYTIKVRAWDEENMPQADLIRQVTVIENETVMATSNQSSDNEAVSGLGETAGYGAAQTGPTPTVVVPTPSVGDIIQVTSNSAQPEPTEVPLYPPPPASPGVPPGPTQQELNNFGPPICNAAEYVGVYTSDTRRRIVITEPDEVPAKTVGGTVVHRAWRLQNVGTCTWGPGYELAFYGGRTMGSGGVVFEDTWPSEPPRRNTVLDTDRLVVPEGKPNQTAVLEVKLQAPTTPGIHQSYWRMRDPHGVFFGPIMGVTLDVVRECDFGIYGAPVINRFRILAAGKVYNPQDQNNVTVEQGADVTLDWDIINAEKFDIVYESPTGGFDTVSTSNTTDRITFKAEELGEYGLALYADNGSCTVQQKVYVNVIPQAQQQFEIGVAVPLIGGSVEPASNNAVAVASLPPNEVKLQWYHFDPSVNIFDLVANVYRPGTKEQCIINTGEVRFTNPNVSFGPFRWLCWDAEAWVLDESLSYTKPFQNDGGTMVTATIANQAQGICSQLGNKPYRVQYTMLATKNAEFANPPKSNMVAIQGECADVIPTEISAAGVSGSAAAASAVGPTVIPTNTLPVWFFAIAVGLVLVLLVWLMRK